jgi:hypothetical protein
MPISYVYTLTVRRSGSVDRVQKVKASNVQGYVTHAA